jgi:tetratricopeptide (TPR) repeat protein
LYTLCPTISTGDSGEFCASSVTLSIPHPPGYPLYILLSKIFTIIIPFGNYAYRINIMSALFSSLTIVILWFTINKILINFGYLNIFIPFISCMFFFSTVSLWQSSIQAEVFSLNIFFTAIICYLLFKFSITNQTIDWNIFYLISFLFGLALGNHHTILLLVPGIVYLFFHYKRCSFSISKLFIIFLFFLFGISIYLSLLIRSTKNPFLDIGNPDTIYNLYRVFTRADYGSFRLTVGEKIGYSLLIVLKQLYRFINQTILEYKVIGFILGLIGIMYGSKKFKIFTIYIFISWIISGPLFILFANLPFNNESEGILYRFYITPNFFWILFIMLGLNFLYEKMNKYSSYIISIFIIIFLCYLCNYNWSKVNWRKYYLTYDYGKNILRTLPKDAILFMDGGDDTFYSLSYLCFAERHRIDVELHDRGGVVFKNIYGNDFRKLTKSEKDIRREIVEKSFINIRPVYYSTFNKNILTNIELIPDGILYFIHDNQQQKKGFESTNKNSWELYVLSRSIYFDYPDYRSRALVPVYLYLKAVNSVSDTEALKYFRYINYLYPDVLWLKNNLLIELHNRAYKLFQENNWELAVKYYEMIINIKPDDITAIINLGVVYERMGDLKMAESLYRKAIEINPEYTEAYYNLGVIYWKNNDWDRVVDMFEKVLKQNPEHQGAKKYLPQAKLKIGIKNRENFYGIEKPNK